MHFGVIIALVMCDNHQIAYKQTAIRTDTTRYVPNRKKINHISLLQCLLRNFKETRASFPSPMV